MKKMRVHVCAFLAGLLLTGNVAVAPVRAQEQRVGGVRVLRENEGETQGGSWIEVEYLQTSARELLPKINAFRTSADTWYWNEDNTRKVTGLNCNELKYDKDLEAIAMQRAAEVTVTYSHNRPNGDTFMMVTSNGIVSSRECLVWGINLDAEGALEVWKEENKFYAGQIHRRSLLKEAQSIGIAHIRYQGKDFWVLEFGNHAASEPGEAFDGLKKVNVRQASEGRWVLEGGKWFYYFGNTKKTGWLKDGADWYYLDGNGVMKTGWLLLGNTWYYLKQSGAMATGWVASGNDWYYMLDSGAMATGWVKDGSDWYYMNAGGAMVRGWVKSGKSWYFMKASGAMATGWVLSGGKWYCMDDSGAMLTGWYKENDVWYYLDASGAMRTGWIKSGNLWYYLNANGAMATGWIFVDGKQYYLYGNGAMSTGWIQVGDAWYYLNGSGAMISNAWAQSGGVWYFMDENGIWNPDMTTESLLICANKSHPLPEGYVPSGLIEPNVARTRSIQMKEPAAHALEAMFSSMKNAGLNPVLTSGYRSADYQKQLYDGYCNQYGKETADTISSRPGYSDHQTGLAADITCSAVSGQLVQAFENTAEGKWLKYHAHEYGFIMRYPAGKESITGYSYEPWHFRFIGVEEAGKVYNAGENESFEEYYGVSGGDYRN